VKEEDLIRRPKIDPLFLVGNLQCVEVVALCRCFVNLVEEEEVGTQCNFLCRKNFHLKN
jgi:hypothetical protein